MPGAMLSLFDVLVAEYEAQGIQPPFPREDFEARRQQGAPESELVAGFYSWLHANGVRRSALCFSGGGIRSATFGLGVVQGLARAGLLKRFDFLSTVSGGGYLGSWLSAWIGRTRRELAERQDPRPAVEVVEEELRVGPASPLAPEPEPVRHLRSYSRYISPRWGLLSADTWTLVAITLRNLLLNWLVLLPLLAAALMVPRVSVLLVRLGTRPWLQAQEGWLLPAMFWASAALGAVVVAFIGVSRSQAEERRPIPPHLRGQRPFLALCLLPLYLMAVLLSLYWAWRRSLPAPYAGLRVWGWNLPPAASVILYALLIYLGGFLLARIWVRRPRHGSLLVLTASGILGGGAAWLAASQLAPRFIDQPLTAELYSCFAAPLLLLLFLVAVILYVGLSSYYTSDADREWLARAGAWVLITIVVRGALSAVVIFGPDALVRGAIWISSLGGISGLVTLVLGRGKGGEKGSPEKGAEPSSPAGRSSLKKLALSIAAPVFALFIMIVLSLGTTMLIYGLTNAVDPGHVWPSQKGVLPDVALLMDVVYGSPWWAVAAVLAGLLAAGLVMGCFVDVNRFSLHAAYRDRLIRAYLGASRGSRRRPHPFTGLDEEDNLQMAELRGNRPFHVVNMTLNLVGGKELAWQDRKAEVFTATPLVAGSFRLGYRDVALYGRRPDGSGALSLGTAMAISGAAASPNMGSFSSPLVTFLLALFNVRLGWWLGNPGPAGERTWATQGPRFAPASLLAEAFGLTDDRHPYIYLSDGGHFENLGLYEMVLRRCHFIVVSDGSGDPQMSFDDLGNAVSRIRVDLGVPIRFERILMRPRPKNPEAYDLRSGGERGSAQPYCALARIGYSCVDRRPDGTSGEEMDGLLLYVKPSLNGTEPADVFHYARAHPTFPHESTADQLYSEQQLESYRELGSHAMSTILAGLPPGASLAELFEKMGKEFGIPG
jgi:hypothetical protein